MTTAAVFRLKPEATQLCEMWLPASAGRLSEALQSQLFGEANVRSRVMITARRTLVRAVLAVTSLTTSSTHALLAQAGMADALAARIDPYVEKQRVVVMTDIANEPDDQMSMVRFLVYSNHFDVEGLIATTSTWMKNTVRPDVLQMLVGAYEEVRPRLLRHQPGFPPADASRRKRTTIPRSW